jgi:hypothetical protein
MITKAKIDNEINELNTRLREEEMKKVAENRVRKRLAMLRECLSYLETNPKEEFVRQQLEEVGYKIERRMSQFDEQKWKDKDLRDLKKAKKEHEKEFGVPRLREQEGALKYLITE